MYTSSRLRKWMALTLVVLMVLPTPVIATSEEDDGLDVPTDISDGPIPTLSLRLDPTHLEAEVSQSQLGSVTFDGTITVDMMRLMRGTVTLTVVVDTGWPATLSGQTFVFQGPGSQDFQAAVVVPPATSALLTGNVIVTGSLKCPGLAPVVAACSAVVTVAPYYSAVVRSGEPTVRVSAGEATSIQLEIWNTGNSPTVLSVIVGGVPQDITVRLEEGQRSMNPDEVWNLSGRVQVSDGVERGRHRLIVVVMATTEHEGDVEVGIFNLTVYVPTLGDRLIWSNVLPAIIIIGVAAGVMVVLWRKGKLPKGIRLPRLSRAPKETGEGTS